MNKMQKSYANALRPLHVYIPRGLRGLQADKWEDLYATGYITGYEKQYRNDFFHEYLRYYAKNHGVGYVHGYTEVAYSFAKQLKERNYPLAMIMDVTKLTKKSIEAL